MIRWLAVCLLLLVPDAAQAQIELSGSWGRSNHEDSLERGPGPYAVDLTGLPLNEEGRARALSHSASQLGLIERQCGMYPPHYIALGPFGLKIWNETHPITGETVAWKIGAWEDRAELTIWMDGRPHPSPNAPHPRGGFTTGAWQGDTLVAYTTHMRAGVIRRNGAPNSDQATMTTHFIVNGDLMTMLVVVEDPIYLAEPWMISKNFVRSTQALRPIGPPCVPGYEGQSGETIPHYLPGANPWIDELTELYGIPRAGILGGAATMYPAFRRTIRDDFVRPEVCLRNCGGPTAP